MTDSQKTEWLTRPVLERPAPLKKLELYLVYNTNQLRFDTQSIEVFYFFPHDFENMLIQYLNTSLLQNIFFLVVINKRVQSF